MKALLLRVGIDKGTDGALAPIFANGTFEYIPLSEKNQNTLETKTFNNTMGVNGVYFSQYLPKKIKHRKLHFDPEFETFTYGDQTAKRNYLLKLKKNDLIVFYSGLTPHKNQIHEEGLYIIGYFTVDNVIDFNKLSNDEIISQSKLLKNNAHIKSNSHENLVIIKGQDKSSQLIKKAILISQKKLNKIGRQYHAVSPRMEKLLGITGSIQRSIPPRFVTGNNIEHLIHLLKIE